MKIALSLVLSIILLGCEAKEEPVPEKIIPVRVVNVERTEISIPIITSGKIYAKEEMILSFKTGGIIKKIFVNEGQSVKKGDILAEIDLSEINASVIQAKSAFEKNTRDLTRIKSLFADSVVTLEQFQNTETAYKVAKANLEIAEFNLNHSKIVAPTNGKIYKKFSEVNQLVIPGSPIFMFGSSDNNWIVKAGITDLDISKIKLKDNAKIYLDSHADKIFSGYVSEIAGSANPMNGTFEIELTIDANKSKIISGMFAKIELFPTELSKSILIPINSIVNANGNIAEIYTLSDERNKAKKISIELGNIIDEKILINVNDININEIVTDGAEYLIDGCKVKVVK